jgi:hypothetical protein
MQVNRGGRSRPDGTVLAEKGMVGIPGQGDSDFEVIPIKIPKLI